MGVEVLELSPSIVSLKQRCEKKKTGTDGMVGEAKEARTAEIVETNNPDTRGEAATSRAA